MVTKVQEPYEIQQVNGVQQAQLPPDEIEDDPYPYGWRVVPVTQPDGQTDYDWVPLTQADFLDPQEEDQMVQSDPHIKLVISLYNRYDDRYRHDPTVGVFSDLKMRWGIPRLQGPAPDLAIVFGLRDKSKKRTSFNVKTEGVRPSLIIEVMSPNYPGDDTKKVEIYQGARVPEYIIINPHFEEATHFELIGYRLQGRQYQPIQPDAQGRLLSETTGVWFGLDETGQNIVLTDRTTGERLLTEEEKYEAHLEASVRAEAEAQRADEERRRAEAEAQRADEERRRAETAEAEVARLRALLEGRNRQ